MSKGEASCTVARGSDGTGGGGVFLGKKLAMAPSGFRIKRWCTSRGPGKGPSGKDRPEREGCWRRIPGMTLRFRHLAGVLVWGGAAYGLLWLGSLPGDLG